ncbi:glycosyltransferase family 4 protein [Frigoribacterium sp. VKM Ac-2530]|uniref:glycosyltransferase family 4 protein n=1 Tax=Frigoribacterium sp. VKM Ac-2530 TaxID=2783822 RepID=UPI00188CBD48|nr:glycosyltransferase family 4 protein [Frigoribacterium sp. VKM Ac-2530]MBF4578668.1 glycosyltransferase family 4 protein [Frigoribacterium sp. VKM Ac-2530]
MSVPQTDAPLRILVVSQYFRPERVSIPVTLADELSRRGHEVEVVTGWPNYPEGKLFPYHRQRLRHTERQGNVTVHRVPLVISHSTSALGRMLNYASFAVSSSLRLRTGRRADVVYVYATQMTASIGPALWKRLFGTPYVLHVQDLWPESITGSGMVGGRASSFISHALTPWLTSSYRRAGHVVAIAPSMLTMLRSRGAKPMASSVVFNWSPQDVMGERPEGKNQHDVERRGTTFVYAGNLGELQDLSILIEAFSLCSDVPDVELIIAGAGVLEAELRDQVTRQAETRVSFTGRLDPIEMRELNARSDFQFVTLKGLEVFRGTIPSKLQNSLASGVPVITTVHGDVSDLVNAEGLGFTAPPSDAAELAAVIRRAASTTSAERTTMASRARRFYERHMSEAAGVSAIEQILGAVSRGVPTTAATPNDHGETRDGHRDE